jgi:phosphoribosylglycinamide formyltransferase-1
MTIRPIVAPKKRPVRVAGFMSGSGSNITRLLERERMLAQRPQGSPFTVCVLVTDNPDRTQCNAHRIAEDFGGLPVVESDIKAYYRERGEKKVSIATPQGFAIREEWTDRLLDRLKPYGPDLGAFGGFIPLTNCCARLPCINVHPGDLSVMRDGKPYLVGLHTVPIKLAILAGIGELRTTTILATPYTQKLEMDEGPVLLISEPLKIAMPNGLSLEALSRPENAPTLEKMASEHQNLLKEVGDWQVFPLTVELVAEGRFALDESKAVYFDGRRIERGVKLPSELIRG